MLYIHNPNKPLSLPVLDSNIFAVIEYQGRQHKLTKDDTVMLDKTNFRPGEIIIFDKVLLVGSNEYTSIGRPYIGTAKVVGTVEEVTKTEKVIIFKKRRRKGYQKNMGHRSEVTIVRVDKVIHSLTENVMNDYKSLI